jgi:hypothetical protein
MTLITKEGLLAAIVLSILPLIILAVLVKLLPPWPDKELDYIEAAPAPTT